MTDTQFHDFDFMFSIQTEKTSDDVTAEELRAALIKRVNDLSDQEMLEACGWSGTYDQSNLDEEYIDVATDGTAELVHPDGTREPAPEGWNSANNLKAVRVE